MLKIGRLVWWPGTESNRRRQPFQGRNVQKLKTSASPGHKMKPCGSHVLLEKRIVAEIDHHRVKTPLEPAIEGVQVTPARPRRRHTVPAVELLLENLAAHLFQILAGLFLVLTFRKQIDQSALAGDLPDSTRYSLDPPDAANPGMAGPASPRSLFG